MSKKDKGWDYLNSNDVNCMSEGEEGDWGYTNSDGSGTFYGGDGSWGYTNSDGSGTYYGADGSWGYKNSDGSGTYYGADGSWGYKNSDGSSTYYGNDGSWGYKNSDGSGSYYGSNNSSTHYDADEEDDDNDDYGEPSGDSSGAGIGLVAGLAGLAIGLGAAAYSKYKAEEAEEERKAEERRREEERIRKEKQAIKEHEKHLRKIRMKALFLNKKNLQIDFSTGDLIGEHYEKVVAELKETGFNNYKAVPYKDICPNNNYFVGEVAQVVINGQTWVEDGALIPYDAEIIVTYHVKKEIVFPYSPRKVTKRNYEELVQELFDLGYTEIYTKEIDDLTTGWIIKDGSVEKISIGGDSFFKKGTAFEYDVEIVIEYHTFAKKKYQGR